MNPNEPLGLPKGSVRALLSLSVIGTFCAVVLGMAFAGVELSDEVWITVSGIATAVLAGYGVLRQMKG